MEQKNKGLCAVILAGGGSRRYGSDKAFMMRGEERVLSSLLFEAGQLCEELFIVTGTGEKFSPEFLAASGARELADLHPGLGPLAGLEAGMQAAASSYVLLLACDMPNLRAWLFAELFAKIEGYEAVVPRVRGRAEPLCAVYDCRLLPRLGLMLEQGELSASGLLQGSRVRYLEIEQQAGKRDLFLNVNYPSEGL